MPAFLCQRMICRGKRFAAASTLALILSAHPLPVMAEEFKTTIYGDWKVDCTAEGCQAQQDIFDPRSPGPDRLGKATPIARLFLLRSGGPLMVKIEGPLGMALEAGMGLMSDGKLALPVPYQTCHLVCTASTELDEHLARTIGDADRFEIAMADINSKIFYFPVSATGYSDALRALGVLSADAPISEKMTVHPQDAPAH